NSEKYYIENSFHLFSVNKIRSLSDFEDCPNLQELYLRKNNIQDINDLVYLQNLPKLKYLWLEENPCVDSAGPNYRKVVLRALPKLLKLDNVEQPMQQSPEGTDPECVSDPIERPSSVPSSPLQRSPAQANQQHTDNFSPSDSQSSRYQNQRSIQQSYERSPEDSPQISGNYRDQRSNLPSSMSTQSMKDYYQGDGYQRGAPPPSTHYRHSQTDLTEWDENSQHNGNNQQNGHQQQAMRRSMIGNGGSQDRSYVDERRDIYQYRNGNVSREDFGEEMSDRRRDGRRNDNVISNAVLSHLAGLHRRPVNRSSNLLSATLCLVKELDYASLEVVEHAVRCRIDELAESI
ncbi:CLUMA_CG006268, isoform A, partial [Clunio marinus]